MFQLIFLAFLVQYLKDMLMNSEIGNEWKVASRKKIEFMNKLQKYAGIDIWVLLLTLNGHYAMFDYIFYQFGRFPVHQFSEIKMSGKYF